MGVFSSSITEARKVVVNDKREAFTFAVAAFSSHWEMNGRVTVCTDCGCVMHKVRTNSYQTHLTDSFLHCNAYFITDIFHFACILNFPFSLLGNIFVNQCREFVFSHGNINLIATPLIPFASCQYSFMLLSVFTFTDLFSS